MSNYPDPVTLLPAERYDRQRAARLAELGLSCDQADLLIDQACAEFDAFVRRWVGWFPPSEAAAIIETLSDQAAELAQEIYQ